MVLVVFLAYYILGEALTGGTVGKGMVRIRVVNEHGEHPSVSAAIVRNILRPVDALSSISSARRSRSRRRTASGSVTAPHTRLSSAADTATTHTGFSLSSNARACP